jgi:hypothetical protein
MNTKRLLSIFILFAQRVDGKRKLALPVILTFSDLQIQLFFSFFLFVDYLHEVVFPGIEGQRDKPDEPSLLFLDSHKYQINSSLWWEALTRGTFTKFFLSHASTELQMLDCRFNAEFKVLLENYLTIPEVPNAHNVREGVFVY